MAPQFHVTIKPAGAACNLACTYCYYRGKDEPSDTPPGPMSPPLLERFIRQYIAAQSGDTVVFTWQGGEPTLAGLEFFRHALALQHEHAGGKRICNDLQTNGLLLDDAWCEFLRANDFLVGLSIDGPADVHDAHRRDRTGRPTHADVVAAARRLEAHGVPYNALAVVHRGSPPQAAAVYDFLAHELSPRVIQFIPCVEPRTFATIAPHRWDDSALPAAGSAAGPGQVNSFVTDWSVEPLGWGRFLCGVFDAWRKDGDRVVVDWFEAALAAWRGAPSPMCMTSPICGRGLAVERDGSVYSCDHYVYEEFRLGDLAQADLGQLAGSARQQGFGLAKQATLPACCRACEFLFACQGLCPRYRFVRVAGGLVRYLCPGMRMFFHHASPTLKRLTRQGVRPKDPIG